MNVLLNIVMNGIKGVLMVLMVIMVFTVSYGVFTRYVLNDSAVWTSELATYSLIWITFLGSAWAIFEKAHIVFDSLLEKLPRTLRLGIQLLFHLLMLAFVSLLVYYGAGVALSAIRDETLTLPISKGVVYLIIPVSGVIMAIGLIMQLRGQFAKQPNTVTGRASEEATATRHRESGGLHSATGGK